MNVTFISRVVLGACELTHFLCGRINTAVIMLKMLGATEISFRCPGDQALTTDPHSAEVNQRVELYL